METTSKILDLEKLEAGEYELNIQAVNVNDIIRETINELREKAKNKNIEIKLNFKDDNIQITTDKIALKKIVHNLIDNGIKFTFEGFVEVITEKIDNEVKIIIKDTGIGMSDDYQKYIFESFSQESMGFKREFEGMGIGLSLTKKFIDLLNGDIIVYSEKNKGSIFEVILPITYKKK